MNHSVFGEFEFWALMGVSFVLPVCVYAVLRARRAVSPVAVFWLGMALVVIAGADVYLLQMLKTMARMSPSLADDAVFASELSFALYLVPALFGSVGINLVSHVLIGHLHEAERRFEDGGARGGMAGKTAASRHGEAPDDAAVSRFRAVMPKLEQIDAGKRFSRDEANER